MDTAADPETLSQPGPGAATARGSSRCARAGRPARRSLWHDETYTIDAAIVTERAETRRELRDALLRLPLIYRSAVILHDSEGLTLPQIAQIQRVGLPAAKQRLRRGRMMLVSDLAEGPRDRQDGGLPMRCWDARSKVSDYLDGDLGDRDRVRLERHLAGCPTCPPLYAGLVGVQAALGARRGHREPARGKPGGRLVSCPRRGEAWPLSPRQ